MFFFQLGRTSGRIAGHFQYQVSVHLSGNSNPVSGQIPDIKKAGISSRISGASLLINDNQKKHVENALGRDERINNGKDPD
jgi:hypothetical protein